MKTFSYKSPVSLREAHEFHRDDHKKVKFFAGGTDLLSLMKHEIEAPEVLINLKLIEGLKTVEYKKGKGFRIGALVSLSDLIRNADIKSVLPLLHQAALQVASPQLRNMATIAGNLCQRPRCWYFRGHFQCLRKGGEICYAVGGENKYHCIIGGDPCFIVHPSDLAVALLGLNATLHVSDETKTEKIPLDSFFVLPEQDYLREHILSPNQIITHIEIPEPDRGIKSCYMKVKERGSWDFAIVSVAALVRTNGKNIAGGKLVFGGIAPIPWTDDRINQSLSGLSLDDRSIHRFSDSLFEDAVLMEKNGYKRTMVRNLVSQLLKDIVGPS